MGENRPHSRRIALVSLLTSAAWAAHTAQDQDDHDPHKLSLPGVHDHEDDRLPNGKSQRDAIAEADHKQALKDAQELIDLATSIRDDVEKAGSYVVPLATVKKTEDIEKLAKRLRSKLKG